MRVLVVSDSHGEEQALLCALREQPAARTVIHLGDGLREAQTAAEQFPELVLQVRGDASAAAELATVPQAAAAACGAAFYASGRDPLPTVVGRLVANRGERLITAESCTGGLVAALLTDTPGSSAWLEGAFVTYSNEAKVELLGVAPALLAAYGAVSEPVALAMLQGALARSRARLGVALTGIAGPDGGAPDKPVGTVCIAWGSEDDLFVETCGFFGRTRREVRLLAAWTALDRLRCWLPGEGRAPRDDPPRRARGR